MAWNHLAYLNEPIQVTLTAGEWDVVIGQVTEEWSKVREDSQRKPYEETLQRIRQTITSAQDRK